MTTGIDADETRTRAILQNLVDNHDLNCQTIVQDTPHGGKHLLYSIQVRPEDIVSWRKKALNANLCKSDCHIEIKTCTMMVTLFPSKHRREKHLAYAQRGIMVVWARSNDGDDQLIVLYLTPNLNRLPSKSVRIQQADNLVLSQYIV